MLQVISTSTFLIIKFAKKYSNFYIYENGMITIINQRTRVSNKTATAIDHILTNSYTEIIFKTAMLKCDASNHFLFALSNQHIIVDYIAITDETQIAENLISVLT